MVELLITMAGMSLGLRGLPELASEPDEGSSGAKRWRQCANVVYASCGFHRRIAARFFAANNFVACTEIDAKNFNFRAADPWREQRSPGEQAGCISQKTQDATEIPTLPETGQSLIGRVFLRSISAERLGC
jgi:hypothetical protein